MQITFAYLQEDSNLYSISTEVVFLCLSEER